MLLLSGCWDEKLFKNLSVVSLAGFEGEMGEITSYYAYPQATSKEMKRVIISAKGATPRDTRQNAGLKTEQTMNLSSLSALLISEDTVKGKDIYEFLDLYFRYINNPVTPKLAIVQGEIKPYFDVNKEDESSSGEFYNRFIKSLEENSFIIPYNMQTAGTLLFEEAQDLTIPYLKLDEQKRPTVDGVALFSGRKYSGENLEAKEGVLLSILNDSIGKNTSLTRMYEGSPLSILIPKIKRKIDVSQNKIEINIKIISMLTEFPKDNLKNNENHKKLQNHLSKILEEDMNKVMKKLQEAKCDAIGLGRIVRAYHPQWYDKEWANKFAEYDISVKVNVEIEKTGILY